VLFVSVDRACCIFSNVSGFPYLLNQTQDSFNPVVVIVVHVEIRCLVLLFQFMDMASTNLTSNCDKGRKCNSNWEKTFPLLKKASSSENTVENVEAENLESFL